MRWNSNLRKMVAGSMGTFTMAYPVLRDGSGKPAHKIIEARTQAASATVRYDGGGRAQVQVGQDEVVITFAEVPADVQSIEFNLLIDIAFSQGGKWRIGDKEGVFPRAKPAQPHLLQDHATRFSFTNALGESLDLTTPNDCFQQLTDNREWNWGIFHWMGVVPFHKDQPQLTFTLHHTPSATPAAKLVDAFGQSTREDWPSKVKSLAALQADVSEDAAYYAALHPPATDLFGGALDSGTKLGFKATGFFHIEKRQGKSWLVDPEGNAFFHLGICGFAPSDDFTYVKGRESIYEWLPKLESEFRTAFREGNAENFSFYVANTIKKYGQPHTLESHVARMITRARAWGFNSMGAFSPTPAEPIKAASFPYVDSLPISEWEGIKRIPGAWEVWDPYDAETARGIQDRIAKELPKRAADPLLIGYFIVNEPRYDDLLRVLPALPATHACKLRFVQSLVDRYAGIDAFNKAWQADASSFDQLKSQGLAVTTDAAKADVKAFVGTFLDTLLNQVTTAIRKADPHHLILGCRLQPATIEDEQLCRLCGKYLDVMSYNYYTYAVDTAALQRYHDWTGGRPLMLSEFYWSSPADSGLTGGREVKSQEERGLAYRHYVEQSAALGFVVGIEWFTLVDQATTGRWFSQYHGESANTGLLSVADRPWKPMLHEVMKTNYTLYPLLFGERKAFLWEDARFKPSP